MKTENIIKIWQRIGLIFAFALINGLVWTAEGVLAQSSSTSYNAVDFVTPEASLSTSSSYALSDSIDYYGGVHASAGYTECTGNFAVLSNCGAIPVPPPPPPPPPPTPPTTGGGGTGAGSDYPAHDDCNQIDCLDENPPEEIPEEPVVPTKPVFHLPNISEPTGGSTPAAEPVVPIVEEVVQPEAVPTVTPAQIQTVVENIEQEIIKAVAPETACEDLVCAQTSVLIAQGSKLRGAAENACTLYTYGGFMMRMNCTDVTLTWIAVGGFVLIFGIGQHAVPVLRKRMKK